MSTTTHNPCDKGNNLLLDCRRDLDSRKTLKRGDSLAAIVLKEEKEINRDHKVCCLLKAEESHDLYRNVNIYLAIDAGCKAGEIEKKVTSLAGKSKELAKAMKEVTACLKKIKMKAGELKNKACDIDTQIKDRCNTKQLQILNDHFQNDHCFEPDGLFNGADLSTFENIVSCIVSQTQLIWDKSDKAFQSSVKIAGIQTFSNVASLKERSREVIKCLGDFKKDIDSNMVSTEASVKLASKEINDCVKMVAMTTMSEHLATTCYEGVASTLDFACSPCEEESKMTIEEICRKVTENACPPKEASKSKKLPGYHA